MRFYGFCSNNKYICIVGYIFVLTIFVLTIFKLTIFYYLIYYSFLYLNFNSNVKIFV